jgi:hypothetical protein
MTAVLELTATGESSAENHARRNARNGGSRIVGILLRGREETPPSLCENRTGSLEVRAHEDAARSTLLSVETYCFSSL